MLLDKVPARYFEDLRTVDGTVYGTFQEACYTRGLLLDKQEAEHALLELIGLYYSPQQMRFVMAQLLIDIGASEKGLWERFKAELTADFADRPTAIERESGALQDIQCIVLARGFGLDAFGLPAPRTFESSLRRELDLLGEEAEGNERHFNDCVAQFNQSRRSYSNTFGVRLTSEMVSASL